MHKLFINGNDSGIVVEIADSFFSRFFGFMGRKSNPGSCLLLKRCNSVHTLFMNFKIKLLFLDSENSVIKINEHLPPWRFTFPVKNVCAILEIPDNLIAQVFVLHGDFLEFK